MRRVRELFPETGLSLTRLGAAVLAVVSLAGQVPQISGVSGSEVRDGAALTALALIAAAVLTSYRRGRLLPGEQFVLPVLAVVAGSAFTGPVATVGIALVLVVVQSLYGSTGGWTAGTVLATLAVPAAIHLSPGVTDAHQLDRLGRTSATGVQGPLLSPIVSGDQLGEQVLGSAHG